MLLCYRMSARWSGSTSGGSLQINSVLWLPGYLGLKMQVLVELLVIELGLSFQPFQISYAAHAIWTRARRADWIAYVKSVSLRYKTGSEYWLVEVCWNMRYLCVLENFFSWTGSWSFNKSYSCWIFYEQVGKSWIRYTSKNDHTMSLGQVFTFELKGLREKTSSFGCRH